MLVYSFSNFSNSLVISSISFFKKQLKLSFSKFSLTSNSPLSVFLLATIPLFSPTNPPATIEN